MTTLSQHLADYLAVRRSLGFDLSFEERVLRVFTRFADHEGADHITVDLFLRWKASFGTANTNPWGHRLGMVVTAEGVETLAQLHCLKQQGCDTYQGFLYSKPLEGKQFARILAAERSAQLQADTAL